MKLISPNLKLEELLPKLASRLAEAYDRSVARSFPGGRTERTLRVKKIFERLAKQYGGDILNRGFIK